jgi:glycosyltransferase involved in cell wall biosynthesis
MPIAGMPMPTAARSARALSATKGHSNFAITEAVLKILYISQYFPPEMGAPAARVSELSRHWAEAGHEVTVLTGFPNHPDGKVRPEYRKRFRRGVSHDKVDGVSVVRTWLLPFPNRRPYERILNYSSFCASASLTGSFLQRADVIIATSPQLLVGLAGWWIARFQRVPFVLEIRDLWPESLAAVGVGNANSLIHRAIGKLAGFLYRQADHIVVVTPAFRERLIHDWLVPEVKISVVQNGVETALFSPPRADPGLRTALGVDGKFVVSFIGTIGLAHGLETLISAAERLQRDAPDVLFMLVGEGADRERVQASAQNKCLANVCFVPQQPRGAIPSYICGSDVCLVLLRNSEVFETVIPTKMLEFMSCARPVILGVKGQAQQILESAHAGISIEPGNSDALCDAVLQLKQNRALREALGRNGREYILQNLSREKTAADYLEVLSAFGKEDVAIKNAAAA